MCQYYSKTTGCKNPKELNNNIQNCSKKQIEKYHCNFKQHPYISRKKENEE